MIPVSDLTETQLQDLLRPDEVLSHDNQGHGQYTVVVRRGRHTTSCTILVVEEDGVIEYRDIYKESK